MINKKSWEKFIICFLWFCVFLFSQVAYSQTVALDFSTLPSAQGWTYFSDGAAETSIFSISSGVLTQNTVDGPYSVEWYQRDGAIDLSVPFTVWVRARVLQDGGYLVTNPFGFCFSAQSGPGGFFSTGLSTDHIADVLGQLLPMDNRNFHDYRMSVTPGVGYELFVDETRVMSGLPRFDVTEHPPNRLIIGDCTRGLGAWAEVTSYRVTNLVRVQIDIKPGSAENVINLSAAGVVPVAILGSGTFDATTVDPSTVSVAGAKVKMIGKSNKLLCHAEDVNGDSRLDLLCQVLTAQFIIEPGSSVAVLEATTFSGQAIRGEDTVQIVKDN